MGQPRLIKIRSKKQPEPVMISHVSDGTTTRYPTTHHFDMLSASAPLYKAIHSNRNGCGTASIASFFAHFCSAAERHPTLLPSR